MSKLPSISPASASTASPAMPTPAASGVKHEDLTAEQKKKWEDTMSMMIWTAPGFQHIFYKLLNAQGNTPSSYTAIMTKECLVAQTDGRNIMVNPDGFFSLALPERVFVTAHEIVHNVYGDVELLHRVQVNGKVPMHDGTSRPFNNDHMQHAMDARINALLVDSRIGKPPKDGHYDKEVSANDSVLDVYKKYYDADPDHDDAGNNPGGFDNLAKPGQATGQNPAQAAGSRNNQQWAVEIASAQTIEMAKSQGKMAGAMKRMFQQLLEPEVPWIDHIETLINRQVGDGGIDWTQPNPWFGAFDFYVPAETGKGAGWIVVWGDTSGSRSDTELQANMTELASIMESVNPARLTVLWCDAEVSYVDELEDPADLGKVQARGAGGGGGTDFTPVTDWITEQGPDEPDLFIGFTDGYVSFPDRAPKYPVIWASSTDHKYPWGQVVRVNKIARA